MIINYITYDSWWDTDKTILPKLCSEGYEVNCFVINPTKEEIKFPNKKIQGLKRTVVIEQDCRDRNPLAIIKAIYLMTILLKSIYKRNTYNVFVPGKNPWFQYLFILLAPKNKTILCIHNFEEHSGGNRLFLLELLKKTNFRHFNNFLFYSKSQYRNFKNAYPYKRAYYFNMPLKDFGSPKNISEDGRFRFLFFGFIKEYKGFDIFLKAANSISNPEALFVIAGNCSEWDKYESLITDKKKFALNIRFIHSEEVADFFCNAEFLVLPYNDATQSGPMLIALHYNLPIIASNLPEFKDLISDGVNGLIFKKGDVCDLTAVLKKALTMDRKDYDKMKENQKRTAIKYQESCNIEDVFKEITQYQ